MNTRDTPLREATQAQLVEELARRLNDCVRQEPPEQWCDECSHFKYGTDRQVQSKTWNPCAKKHRMAFYVPQGYESPDTFGYFRAVCPDRTPRNPPEHRPTTSVTP